MKDIVGIGVIGAGFARTTQIPGFKNCEGARGVVIASAHREHAEEVARESIFSCGGQLARVSERDHASC